MKKSYIIVYMKQTIICLFLLSILFFGCGSQPAAQKENVQAEVAVEIAEIAEIDEDTPSSPPEIKFDPGSISREVFESTKTEVRQYIEKLNGIIKSKKYDEWKANLSDEYFNYISSPEHLKSASEMPGLKMRNIVLKDVKDYFNHVVVPSRANYHVDDIEFLSQNQVKAISIDPRNSERLRLYELEKTGDTWKIIN